MSKINDGGAAFPRGDYHPNGDGMSLRDWFAGQALVSVSTNAYPHNAAVYAMKAYELADAMLKAREGGAL